MVIFKQKEVMSCGSRCNLPDGGGTRIESMKRFIQWLNFACFRVILRFDRACVFQGLSTKVKSRYFSAYRAKWYNREIKIVQLER